MKKILAKLVVIAALLSPAVVFAAAPAFDAVAHNNALSTSVTISHTVAGAGECDVLSIQIVDTASDVVTGVTDNGTAMTRLDSSLWFSSSQTRNWWVYTYELNPAPSGTTNIVVSLSGSFNVEGIVMTYSGCGGVDSHTLLVSSTASSPFSTTLATNFVNDTMVGIGVNDNSTVTGTWGQTTRLSGTAFLGGNYGDKTIATASTVTMSFTASPAQSYYIQGIALCPTGGCSLPPVIFPAADKFIIKGVKTIFQ